MRNFKYQIIGGKVINMAPLADPNHGSISIDIAFIFKQYFSSKNIDRPNHG
jgi:hypothetical protein